MITREQFNKTAEKVENWKETFSREELDIIGLWLAGRNEKQIAEEINIPLGRVNRKIHGVNRWGKDSVYKRVMGKVCANTRKSK